MINCKITKEQFKTLCEQRLSFWTKDEKVQKIYAQALADFIYEIGEISGDIDYLVDNFYINETNLYTKEELKECGYEPAYEYYRDNEVVLVSAYS